MKKILLVLLAFAALACSKDHSSVDSDPPLKKGELSYVMPLDSVRALALKLPSTFSDNPQTKSSGKRIKEIVPFTRFSKGVVKTRSAGDVAPSLDDVYVVNYENEQGFAIICADKRLPDVLGYSDSGSISDTMSNPGMGMVMELIPGFISRAAIGGPGGIDDEEFFNPDPDKPNPNYVITGTTIRYTDYEKSVLPLVQVKWWQETPFNKFMPPCSDLPGDNMPAGCVPVAIMQIMSYYGVSMPINGQNLNWDRIRTMTKGDDFFWKAEENQMAELSRLIGLSTAIQYSCGASGTSNYDKIRQTFNSHGYNQDYQRSYDITKVTENIFNGRPVYVGGYRPDGKGHAWVIDGVACSYKLRVKFKDTYINFSRVSSEILESEVIGIGEYLVHCNWGWHGKGNGYFQNGLFDPYYNSIPDEGSEGITIPGENYKYDMDLIYNISPKP